MTHNNIWTNFFSKRSEDAKRVGRGIGSGLGKTCGKGHKGQGQRKGAKFAFEGGQTPLFRRMPKRGGGLGYQTKVNKIFVVSETILKSKFDTVEKYYEMKNGDELQFINYINKVCKISFYYKRIKIIGCEDKQVKLYSIPGHSTLPKVNREARIAKTVYRNG